MAIAGILFVAEIGILYLTIYSVQCMHIGPYDNEPETVAAMHAYMEQAGYTLDITDTRYHHEIYLSDPRKTAPEKLKTVVRHPIKRI